MKNHWKYVGDIDLQYGGAFINMDPDDIKYGYANVVRIAPASDAGLPDNQFWIEILTVNGLDDETRVKQALDCCGWIGEGEVPTWQKIESLMMYGYYDQDESIIVQIGAKVDPFYNGREQPLIPDIIIRANASLRNWVKRNYLRSN